MTRKSRKCRPLAGPFQLRCRLTGTYRANSSDPRRNPHCGTLNVHPDMNNFQDPADCGPCPETSPDWPVEFAGVTSCRACTSILAAQLLRDEGENLPQPGYIGMKYWRRRVLLVGQNPALPPQRLATADRPYTAALRELLQTPTVDTYARFHSIVRHFIPRWPVHGSYFPLAECGLGLDEIAYCNIVRCRTLANRAPSAQMTNSCARHFVRWLELLRPSVVVFIGKWAHDRGMQHVQSLGLPCTFINRQRNLSTEDRSRNRQGVVETVKKASLSCFGRY